MSNILKFLPSEIRRQLFIALLIFLLMSTINICGGITNTILGNRDLRHFEGELKDVPQTFEFVGLFCVLYLWISMVRINISNIYRIPILRIFLWTTLALIDILTKSNSFYTFDYGLALINSGLCTFYDTIYFEFYNGGTGSNYFEIFVIGIFLFAIYEFLILNAATYLADKIIFKKKRIK